MRKIRDVLRLSAAGMSKRKIAASLGMSPTAAGEGLQRARRAGVRWPLHKGLTDEALEVHVKSEESYRLRLLLTPRRNLSASSSTSRTRSDIRSRRFGLSVGDVSRGQFEARVRELVADDPLIAGLTDCMLRARAALWQEYLRLHKVVAAIVRRRRGLTGAA